MSPRTRYRRFRAYCERVDHAWDLWSRLGYSWRAAWHIAGTWQ